MMDLEIFSDRLKQLRKESKMTQTELGIKIGKTKESAQAYVSKLETKEAKPDCDTICLLADIFNVSIDWLVGRLVPQKNQENLTPRQICEMLLSIFRCNRYNLSFGGLKVRELCYIGHETGDAMGYSVGAETRENAYTSLYFSNWDKPASEEDRMVCSQIGNRSSADTAINEFVSRLRELTMIYKKGNLTEDMYERIVESYLADVPDR